MTLGGIAFENFGGLSSMPQKAASAWSAIETGITGASYRPIVYVGSQTVKGVNHWFIAEQTFVTAEPEKHLVKIAANEFNGKYKLVPHSIETIF